MIGQSEHNEILRRIAEEMRRSGIAFTAGMTEADSDRIAEIYGLCFPPPLAAFYRMGVPVSGEEYEFVRWTDFSPQNIARIRARIAAPIEHLRTAVEKGVWIPAWGECPASVEEVRCRFDSLARRAPRMIPIFSHRYMPLWEGVDDPPVFSAVGQDIVCCGADFASYLRGEFLGENSACDLAVIIPFWGEIAAENEAAYLRAERRRRAAGIVRRTE